MPVSKHRKKKKQKKSGPPPPKSMATPKKRKLTRQQILIYVISTLVILSMAIGFLASGSSRRGRVQTTPSPPGQNFLLGTPAPDDQSGGVEDNPTPETTVEPTTEN